MEFSLVVQQSCFGKQATQVLFSQELFQSCAFDARASLQHRLLSPLSQHL